MPAPVIAERIKWPYSMSPLTKKLAEIRPEYVGIDPVDRVAACRRGRPAKRAALDPTQLVSADAQDVALKNARGVPQERPRRTPLPHICHGQSQPAGDH